MATETRLGTIGGLQLSARSSALISSLLLWVVLFGLGVWVIRLPWVCLLYTSDAADERPSVDLGGRRIFKKKKYKKLTR